jgi:hypothetical protein
MMALTRLPMKVVLIKTLKIVLVLYAIVAGIFMIYQEWIMPDEDVYYTGQLTENLNPIENMRKSGGALMRMGKAIAWPYFLFQ